MVIVGVCKTPECLVTNAMIGFHVIDGGEGREDFFKVESVITVYQLTRCDCPVITTRITSLVF